MKIKRRLLATAATVAAATGLVVGAAQPASAASYDWLAGKARSACGSGYKIVQSHALSDKSRMFLLYAGGWNCAVHVKNLAGPANHISIALSDGETTKRDSGFYSTYAGPVYVYAPNECVEYWGAVATPDRDYTYDSGWTACG